MAADNDLHPTTGSELEPAASSHAVEHAVDHEQPEDWGWHHEFSTGRQVGGWVTFLILGAMLTTTHYNRTANIALILGMVVLAGGLIWDRRRRRTLWRSEN